MISVSVSSDGRRIVSGTRDSSVRVRKHDESGRRSEMLKSHTDRAISMSASSDGKRIVSGRHNTFVRV